MSHHVLPGLGLFYNTFRSGATDNFGVGRGDPPLPAWIFRVLLGFSGNWGNVRFDIRSLLRGPRDVGCRNSSLRRILVWPWVTFTFSNHGPI